MASTIVLLRHGQSEWNAKNLFTGWWDSDLSEQGRVEATDAGTKLRDAGIRPDVVHTSLQTRAIRTAQLCLDEMDLLWLPVRRHWRLNERHYGDLTGRNKVETVELYGAEQVFTWRRSYDVPPPPITEENETNPNLDARYALLPQDVLPTTECLKDVVERMLPYWFDQIVPDLAIGRIVLIAAHGNSIRALVKHLDQVSDADIAQVEIPTGEPLVYVLDERFRPIESMPAIERALGDPHAVRAAAEAVRRQTGSG